MHLRVSNRLVGPLRTPKGRALGPLITNALQLSSVIIHRSVLPSLGIYIIPWHFKFVRMEVNKHEAEEVYRYLKISRSILTWHPVLMKAQQSHTLSICDKASVKSAFTFTISSLIKSDNADTLGIVFDSFCLWQI